MKKRWIAGGIVLLILWLCMVPLTYNLDVLLRGAHGFTLNPIVAFPVVFRDGTLRRLLGLMMGVCLLGVVACLTAGSGVSSRTGMQRLTPDIEIPVAVGQGQFGTARFLNKNAYEKNFNAYTLSRGADAYENLMQEGKKDAEEIDKN